MQRLSQSMMVSVRNATEMHTAPLPSYFGLWDAVQRYIENNKPIHASFVHQQERVSIPFYIAPNQLISKLDSEERWGVMAWGTILIASHVVRDHPTWVPYVAMKLYLEKFVDTGLDNSGKAKHWEALKATLLIAKETLPQDEFLQMRKMLELEERTGFFDLDPELQAVLSDPEKRSEHKRRYLQFHRQNWWVRQGRLESELHEDSLYAYDGDFLIWAERGFRELEFENPLLAREFILALLVLDENETLIIGKEYASIAYALTEEVCGVPIIEFVDGWINQENAVRTNNRRFYKTLEGIERRLSYALFQIERRVNQVTKDASDLLQLL